MLSVRTIAGMFQRECPAKLTRTFTVMWPSLTVKSCARNLPPLPQLNQAQSLTLQPSNRTQGERDHSEDLRHGRLDPITGELGRSSNWNYGAELYALSRRLGHDLNHVPSLRIALTHKSMLSFLHPSKGQHNGRLVVLGKAVLVHYVQEYLYFTYPNLEGNMLFDVTAFLTNHTTLTEAANYLGVSNLIRTSYKSDLGIGRAFCAVVGALYVDKGPQDARKVVHDFLIPQLTGKDFHELVKLEHPKFMLRAILQKEGQPAPISRLLKETGRLTHFPSFVVGIYSGEALLAEGCGTSLKRAEKEATVAALMKHYQARLSNISLPSDHEDYLEEDEVNLRAENEETRQHI